MGFIWSSVQVLTSSSSPRFICFRCLFAREVKQVLRKWKHFRIKEQYFLFFVKKKKKQHYFSASFCFGRNAIGNIKKKWNIKLQQGLSFTDDASRCIHTRGPFIK